MRKSATVINLSDISEHFTEGGEISVETLTGKGLIDDTTLPLKILGDGEISVPLDVRAQKFSTSAVSKIEKAGGSAQVIG